MEAAKTAVIIAQEEQMSGKIITLATIKIISSLILKGKIQFLIFSNI